ncbi:MAG: nucleotide exchange factor GrpE [Patescibacteria group bacterium]|nr:nucleotide exchange factor GrpE [Patescibacteria group bacterium]MDD5164614.1 nucleotide exchange factor GrpE [Patescibacteria group bacterium]MDD5534544.1 nucleotide exchange factor GrpE [Patescibacteria group bacterium]
MSDEEIKKLQEEIELMKQQAEEYLNGWKRTKADYLNREKEIDKEKIEWIKFANLELILNFLPIMDSFDHSVKNLTEIENSGLTSSPRDGSTSSTSSGQASSPQGEWANGVLKIKDQFESFLKAQGVEKIKTLGEKFDPMFHEAIGKQGEENEIVEEIQSGYVMHGRVIRPAKVIIK